jgi:predicted nucleotidyltransferase
MVKSAVIDQVKQDFSFIEQNPKILGLMLYGSSLRDDNSSHNDIDICIVAPKQNLYEIYRYIMHNLNHHVGDYDIRFFEELPLDIQGEIIDHGIVVYSPDEPALYEYFFFAARKEWEELKFHIKQSI